MGRPFRFSPPTPSPRLIDRPRIDERLARRTVRRVTTVTAGPGFGKTVALVTAIERDRPNPDVLDLWLSCEPADASRERLLAGLRIAVGLDHASVEGLADWAWAQAPAAICLTIDDVHEVPEGSGGAELLAELVTSLPANAHLILASRDRVPIPLARLAASGQLERLDESDLLFDGDELDRLGRRHGVDRTVLDGTGGWPALVELTVHAGVDLVVDYLWEEVLAGVEPARVRGLARFMAVGGGDDEIVAAIDDDHRTVHDLVGNLPLVARSASGEAALHPLWGSVLRRQLSDDDAAEACRRAAAIHRRRGHISTAIDLLVDADDWGGVIELMREAEIATLLMVPTAELERWHDALPAGWRSEPVALLARGLVDVRRAPHRACDQLRAAAAAFRAAGDVDGEITAIGYEGVVRWWSGDLIRLAELHARSRELADSGAKSAEVLCAIGDAAVDHLRGDSEAVLRRLSNVEADLSGGWEQIACWLRSVAYRREGDLDGARLEIENARASHFDPGWIDLTVAGLRADWLDGRIDHVCTGLAAAADHYDSEGNRYVGCETRVELAAKLAWLGDVRTARRQLDESERLDDGVGGSLLRILRNLASVALSLADGDENAAARLLAPEDPSGPDGWYWRDRAALALFEVLSDDDRYVPVAPRSLAAVHRPGVELGRALRAARRGDLGLVRDLRWPESGIVRAHLPTPWIVELAAAASAAGRPAPVELLRSIGPGATDALRRLESTPRVVAAARSLARQIGDPPERPVRVEVLGPLRVLVGGGLLEVGELRRQRVRELLTYLVIHRRVRRERVATDLWPDLDGVHNMRVTLTYLQRVLQPERPRGETPYFLRADGPWLELVGEPLLSVDLWELEHQLDEADRAEHAGSPSHVVAAVLTALPMWKGEPLADVANAAWAELVRAHLVARYVRMAIRAAELLIAAGRNDEADAAARAALRADPYSEIAHCLVIRSRLAGHDVAGARRSYDTCRAALAEIDAEPSPATRALLDR